MSTLNSRYCRFVLRYFRDASEDAAPVADLAAAFARETGGERDRAAIQLHHEALPRLEAVGVVDYDARSETARYYDLSPLDGLASRLLDAGSGSPVESQ